MNRYGMYLKNGKDLIHLTQRENTEQAIKFFADIKKLSVVEFNKIFIVKEIKDETVKQSVTSRSNKIKHSNS
tara:strand:- start:16 stop:231 length:216 start_codon:yes stop_codon:yes gene_type:complete